MKLQKYAFIDRDGTLIFEPPDTKQIGSLEKLRVLPGVVDGLKSLQQQGFKLLMVSNQDGMGTRRFPRRTFEKPQAALMDQLKKEGIIFSEIFICPHLPSDQCLCRKPKIGLVENFLEQHPLDPRQSFILGDRETDERFAQNLGIPAFRMETNGSFPRIGSVTRKTNETDISILLNLDGSGKFQVNTGLGFFNHMLEQFSKHSLIDLCLEAQGDLHIDEHHMVEDTGLALGEALAKALGKKRAIRRYGFLLPMDDTLAEVAVDLGGRPYLAWNVRFTREYVGDLPTELVEHFFKSVSDTLKANIHVKVRYSRNEHHKLEAIFKAFAKALRMAATFDPRSPGLPSTKGIL